MPQISASAKGNEKKNNFRECPLAEGGDLGDTGENGSRVLLLVVAGRFPPRLPHLSKCPYTTDMRPYTQTNDNVDKVLLLCLSSFLW